MPDFNVSEIIGKQLITKEPTKVLRFPFDSDEQAQVISVLNPGQTVGTVYAYLEPKQGRKNFYWQFVNNDRYYYVRHRQGAFDVVSLRNQGAKTTEQKALEIKEAKKSTFDKIKGVVLQSAIGAALVIGAFKFLDKKRKAK